MSKEEANPTSLANTEGSRAVSDSPKSTVSATVGKKYNHALVAVVISQNVTLLKAPNINDLTSEDIRDIPKELRVMLVISDAVGVQDQTLRTFP